MSKILGESYSLNLAVCLICDVATHCTLTYHADIENISASTAMSVSDEKTPEFTSSLDFKTSSHSSMQRKIGAKGKYFLSMEE